MCLGLVSTTQAKGTNTYTAFGKHGEAVTRSGHAQPCQSTLGQVVATKPWERQREAIEQADPACSIVHGRQKALGSHRVAPNYEALERKLSAKR